ncbi:alpha/beta hydrolase [Streptomyces sp. M19]
MDRPLGVDIRYTSEQTLQVSEDIELYYELQGDEGPHITLVNNFFIIAPIWRNYTAALAERNRVLTYDLRNQGASSLKADLDWDDHVTDLLALLDGLGVEKTHLVGTSTSAFICRDFALRYPERVSGLIMVGPSCTPSDGLKRRATERACINSLANGGTQTLWDHLYSVVFAEDAMREMGAAGYLGLREAFTAVHPAEPMLANLKAALQATEGPELLAGIKVPTLLLLGDQDPLWEEGTPPRPGASSRTPPPSGCRAWATCHTWRTATPSRSRSSATWTNSPGATRTSPRSPWPRRSPGPRPVPGPRRRPRAAGPRRPRAAGPRRRTTPIRSSPSSANCCAWWSPTVPTCPRRAWRGPPVLHRSGVLGLHPTPGPHRGELRRRVGHGRAHRGLRQPRDHRRPPARAPRRRRDRRRERGRPRGGEPVTSATARQHFVTGATGFVGAPSPWNCWPAPTPTSSASSAARTTGPRPGGCTTPWSTPPRSTA